MSKLSPNETLRYSRHFPVIGLEGQQKLKQAKVICIGCGGLSSPALQYLVAAGIGTCGLVDDDQVDLSNLHRQILFTEADVGLLKVDVAAQQLSKQNPHVILNTYPIRLNHENAADLIHAYDIVLDGSDNYRTRYLLNDICQQQQKPLVSASISQFEGQCSVFNYQDGPCYRCLYPSPPPDELTPNCALSGVLGVLPGILGCLQATEVINIILQQAGVLSGRLLMLNAQTMAFKELQIKKNPQCPLCHHSETSKHLFTKADQTETTTLDTEIEAKQLKAWLEDKTLNIHLIDVREAYEHKICHIGGKLMPLSQFKLEDIDAKTNDRIVIYCKTGNRSRRMVKLLRAQGYQQAYSLKGGITAWAKDIDPNMPSY